MKDSKMGEGAVRCSKADIDLKDFKNICKHQALCHQGPTSLLKDCYVELIRCISISSQEPPHASVKSITAVS